MLKYMAGVFPGEKQEALPGAGIPATWEYLRLNLWAGARPGFLL